MSTLGIAIFRNQLANGSCWQLKNGINGYAKERGPEIITQARSGRIFELIDLGSVNDCEETSQRISVRLLEDGYQCWIKWSEVVGHAFGCGPWQPTLLTKDQIQQKVPHVLNWIENAARKDNQYHWGGPNGPDIE